MPIFNPWPSITRAIPYVLGALLVLTIALLVWLFTNKHDAFMAECMPRSSPEACEEQWREMEARP